MTSFDARLRMLGHTGLPLGVEVDLTGERMTVTAGGAHVANWALKDITISSLPDGFHIEAEGEEVILNLTDEERFARAIGRWQRQSDM
ncbi:MAG: hypothetical protein OEM39_01355 [Acidimicrobiia bacterium]|nr:hypothetical protein [Acidimicrobiia bacterium]MDH3462822.1 hypothetical protein [Acidimicrobiia bacterium]